MSANRMFLAIDLLVCCLLLFPSAFSFQTPSKPGKLLVRSSPAGADITIDRKHMNQPTDATFVASPGTHKVSVTGGPGKLNCREKEIQVKADDTTEVKCSDRGWQ